MSLSWTCLEFIYCVLRGRKVRFYGDIIIHVLNNNVLNGDLNFEGLSDKSKDKRICHGSVR